MEKVKNNICFTKRFLAMELNVVGDIRPQENKSLLKFWKD